MQILKTKTDIGKMIRGVFRVMQVFTESRMNYKYQIYLWRLYPVSIRWNVKHI